MIARNAILAISEMAPTEFVAIANERYCIAPDQWIFSEYHAAAAAAVQEDGKLNRLTYTCVPRKLSESDFWRLVRPPPPLPRPATQCARLGFSPPRRLGLSHRPAALSGSKYFSKVLYVLDSVKEHGTYPPPASTKAAKPKLKPPPPPADSSCLVQ